MAKGRFLSKGISQSDQVAALPNDTSRLIFTWMLAHADCEGRLPADPRKIKGVVLTLLDIDLSEIERALQAMHDVKLIELYVVDGTRYLHFPGWSRHQKIRKEREAPPYPGPPSVLGAENHDTSAGEEVEHDAEDRVWDDSYERGAVTPGGLQESSGTSTSSSPSGSPTTSRSAASGSSGVRPPKRSQPASKVALDDVTTLLGLFNTHRGKLPQAVELTKFRRGRLETLLREHGLEKASEYLVSATKACANDPWWVDKGYGIDNLLRDDRVVARAESYSAKKQGNSIRGDLQAAAARNGWELP